MELDGRVRESLAADTRFSDVRSVAETGSTNRDVAALAGEGAPEGLVLTADFQTSGRGRLDRTWEARPGDGLLVSVLLRPGRLEPERWHLLTAAVALAAREAVLQVAGVTAEIKWPNDLLVGGAKLAGILAESQTASGPQGPAVVVGMGLNVHGGPPGAAVLDDLAGHRVGRQALLEQWLRALDRRLGNWNLVSGEYAQLCSTIGRDVSVQMSEGVTIEGRAEATDAAGRLLLRRPDGSVETVAVGDVTHLRW